MLSFSACLFPSFPDFCIDISRIEGSELLVEVHSRKSVAACPQCRQSSAKVHGFYTRHPADIPCGEYPVRLVLRVRRFVCQNHNCLRRTFAEAFPDLVAIYARRTRRQANVLQELAFAVGGRAGSPLARRFGVPASRQTLLRLLRQCGVPAFPPPRVLGIDDWAWRKGRRYGTILVDLERHTPIDLLPDCTTERVSTWLKSHPSIEVVSRDRDSAFADAIRKGAPQAVQVADRWHLIQNLYEALKDSLGQKHQGLQAMQKDQKMTRASKEPFLGLAGQNSLSEPEHPLTQALLKQQMNRSKRLARYEEVIALHQQGLSDRAIAKVLQRARGTVLSYVHAETFPERKVRAKKPSILDPYVPFILEQWKQGQRNASQFFRHIQARGYPGSQAVVRQFVRELKDEHLLPLRTLRQLKQVAPALFSERLSSREIAWLFLAPVEKLEPEQRSQLEQLCQAQSSLQETYELSQSFVNMVTEQKAEQLLSWLAQAKSNPFAKIRSLASGIQRDLAAVSEALSSVWSQGQVEGQVNRLKTIKRQMYGRASFEVLRLRVLHAA